MTALQTEEMVGHRARKALLGRGQWFAAEDAALATHYQAAARLDRWRLALRIVPYLWLALGMLTLLAGIYATQASLLDSGSVALLAALIVALAAWHGIADAALLLMDVVRTLGADALRRAPRAPQPLALLPDVESDQGLTAKGLTFRYDDSQQPLIDDLDLTLQRADRVIVSGDSGIGKSTLGALLAGRIEPNAGTVLSGGLDRHLLGAERWRREVCYTPQAHTNHIVTETLAFNLLMGTSWPPLPPDLARAQAVLEELGLGALLERMPAGIMQVVGDNGWRLSQGERLRVFVARGILQDARLLIVDEPLASLDPQTAHRVLDVLEQRAQKLMLISHR